MDKETIKRNYSGTIRSWWLPGLLGLLFIIAAFYVFAQPARSYAALSITFGILIILSGIAELYLGIKLPVQTGRGWVIAGGAIEILLGIVLLQMPALLAMAIPFLFGFWLMLRGFLLFGAASDMSSMGVPGSGWPIFMGILTVIAAFIVIFNPIIGAGAVLIWFGISLMIAAVGSIATSVQLFRLGKAVNTAREQMD